MSLVEQFKTWVAEQPPEQTIDHRSYESCALGEFARTLPEDENGDRVDGWNVAWSLHQAYGDEPYNIIGNGGKETQVNKAVPLNTYGELSAWLQTLEPSFTPV